MSTRQKSTLITIFLVLLLVIFSCSKNEPTQPSEHGELIPLKVGNYWVYRIYIFDNNDNIINEYLDTLKVTSTSSDGRMFRLASST